VVRQVILILFLGVAVIASETNLSPVFLADRASLVIRGVVLSKTVKKDSAKGIVTEIELQVRETWKGNSPGKSLTIVQPGGILGEQRVVTSSEANYKIDEDVVVFLAPGEDAKYLTVSAGNGKFHVDSSSSDPVAVNIGGSRISISNLKSIVSKKE
jgi:hypothetical protein